MSNKKIIACLHGSHDANITFYNPNNEKVFILELERLVRKRYFRLHFDNTLEEQISILRKCIDIGLKEIDAVKVDILYVGLDSQNYIKMLKEVFGTEQVHFLAKHHDMHAASTWAQCPYEEALIFSYDGGGDKEFFCIYHTSKQQITKLATVKSDFGGCYLLCGSWVSEVAQNSRHHLALAGKLMGLCAYGVSREDLVGYFSEFMISKNCEELSAKTNYQLKNIKEPWKEPLENYCLSGKEAYDFAATAQKGFEEAFLNIFSFFHSKYPNLPVCVTGGGALNVLVNERLKTEIGVDVFVSPNPSDCGLSFGLLHIATKKKFPNVTYSGLPILDINNLENFVRERNAREADLKEVASLIKSGLIIGIVQGGSEVGPRALGNRSIVCDPTRRDMKDVLNAKVKFREWFRPFAPFCKKEDAEKYFNSRNFDNLEFMSFAPLVKNEYREKLPSITHADGSARLQVVTPASHSGFYDLLTEFGKISDINVLLNTSFNIKGKPILSKIEDALFVLDNTELDAVWVEGYLFEKQP